MRGALLPVVHTRRWIPDFAVRRGRLGCGAATAHAFPERHLIPFTVAGGRMHLVVRPAGDAADPGPDLAPAFARAAAALSAAEGGRPPDQFPVEAG